MRKDFPVAFEGQQVWFLTGSQNLYGEETLHHLEDLEHRGPHSGTPMPVKAI